MQNSKDIQPKAHTVESIKQLLQERIKQLNASLAKLEPDRSPSGDQVTEELYKLYKQLSPEHQETVFDLIKCMSQRQETKRKELEMRRDEVRRIYELIEQNSCSEQN